MREVIRSLTVALLVVAAGSASAQVVVNMPAPVRKNPGSPVEPASSAAETDRAILPQPDAGLIALYRYAGLRATPRITNAPASGPLALAMALSRNGWGGNWWGYDGPWIGPPIGWGWGGSGWGWWGYPGGCFPKGHHFSDGFSGRFRFSDSHWNINVKF